MVSRIKLFFIKQILLKLPRNKSQAGMKRALILSLDEFRKLTAYKSVIVQFDVDPQ
jgi:hypothetical protein